jgi:NAD(P)-dependent dehydrogenase (short-subunit alcohol dehydrogenase family)
MSTDLGCDVAVVTGASSGIGAATASELARRGARVVLAARRSDDLDARVREITAAGAQAVAVPTDVTDDQQRLQLVKEAEATFGPIDLLVNNAGVFWRRALADTASDDLDAVIDVNLVSAVQLTRVVLPGMLERGRGSLIFVGSLSGRVAMEPVYSASKYGLRGFALALRRQLAGTGVSASLVSPGNIRTDMTRHVGGDLPGPGVVADAICELVRHPRREIVVPPKHQLIAWLEQTVPGLADVVHRHRHWSPVNQED